MHDEIGMADWFPIGIVVIAAIIFFGSIAVTIDAIRRPKTHFGTLGRWPYVIVQGALLVLSVLGAISSTGLTYTAALGVMIVVASVQMIVYLLRVVFPSPARLKARCEPGHEGEL